MEKENKKEKEIYETQAVFVFKRFLRHRLAVAAGIVVILLLILAIFAHVFAPKDCMHPQLVKTLLNMDLDCY